MNKLLKLLAELKAKAHNKVRVEEIVTEIEGLVSGNYLAGHADLHCVLAALIGPDHHIRELQYTRSLPDNAINRLVAQFNDQNKEL